MLVWLIHYFGPLLEDLELISSIERRAFITTRTALASFTAFFLAILFGPIAIRWLKARFRERIASDSARLNELHAQKNDTPTMGGLFILAAFGLAVILWCDFSNRYVLLALFVTVSLGAIGAIDDWIKLSTHKKGLTVRQKFLGQWLVALIAASTLYVIHQDKPGGLEGVDAGRTEFPLGHCDRSHRQPQCEKQQRTAVRRGQRQRQKGQRGDQRDQPDLRPEPADDARASISLDAHGPVGYKENQLIGDQNPDDPRFRDAGFCSEARQEDHVHRPCQGEEQLKQGKDESGAEGGRIHDGAGSVTKPCVTVNQLSLPRFVNMDSVNGPQWICK